MQTLIWIFCEDGMHLFLVSSYIIFKLQPRFDNIGVEESTAFTLIGKERKYNKYSRDAKYQLVSTDLFPQKGITFPFVGQKHITCLKKHQKKNFFSLKKVKKSIFSG